MENEENAMQIQRALDNDRDFKVLICASFDAYDSLVELMGNDEILESNGINRKLSSGPTFVTLWKGSPTAKELREMIDSSLENKTNVVFIIRNGITEAAWEKATLDELKAGGVKALIVMTNTARAIYDENKLLEQHALGCNTINKRRYGI